MMPQAGRIAAAVVGGLLILASVSSVSGTLIVTRLVRSRLTRWIDRGVDGVTSWRRRAPPITGGATGC